MSGWVGGWVHKGGKWGDAYGTYPPRSDMLCRLLRTWACCASVLCRWGRRWVWAWPTLEEVLRCWEDGEHQKRGRGGGASVATARSGWGQGGACGRGVVGVLRRVGRAVGAWVNVLEGGRTRGFSKAVNFSERAGQAVFRGVPGRGGGGRRATGCPLLEATRGKRCGAWQGRRGGTTRVHKAKTSQHTTSRKEGSGKGEAHCSLAGFGFCVFPFAPWLCLALAFAPHDQALEHDFSPFRPRA